MLLAGGEDALGGEKTGELREVGRSALHPANTSHREVPCKSHQEVLCKGVKPPEEIDVSGVHGELDACVRREVRMEVEQLPVGRRARRKSLD